jgi:shikimate dehydrogenase
VSGEQFKLGLIGWPLEHSLSPVIHAAALRAIKLQGEYLLYPIPPLPAGAEALRQLLDDLRMGKIDGLNVTIPHKGSIQPLLDRLTPVAEAIGAVNTILREGDELIGDNTDMEGFLRDLDATLSPKVDGALILGAGGAARAVAYGLCKNEWKVLVASRRMDQATELAVSIGGIWDQSISPISLEVGEIEAIQSEITLIVNATPTGMAPNLDTTPWPLQLPFPPGAMIYDLVYVPQETALVRSASQRGLRAVTGLGMLLEQAVLAFELWTGREAPIAAMRSAAQATFTQPNRSGGI